MRRNKVRPGRLVRLHKWTKFPNQLGTIIEIHDLDASAKVLISGFIVTLAIFDFEIMS